MWPIGLVFILIATYFLVFLGKRIKIPTVVSFILSGLLFNIYFLKQSFIVPNEDLILFLGNLGLLALMFLAGLETSWSMLYKEKRDSFFIAFFAWIVPFLSGFLFFWFFGFSFLTSAISGLAISITAEATKARVLIDLKKLKTKIGAVMMSAGIVDDIIGIVVFIILSLIAGYSFNENLLGFSAIACFFIGVFVQAKAGRLNKPMKVIEKLFLFAIVPFFFISMGIRFEFNSLVLNPFLLAGILFLAFTSKIGGVFIAKFFTELNWRQAYLIGWAMNSRGAIELVFAMMGFSMGLLNAEIYSGLVVTALVTTLVFPFVITYIIKKNPKIMDENG